MVVGFEEEADDREDNDGEDGHDNAVRGLGLSSQLDPSSVGGTHHDHACMAPTTGFILTGGC